MRMHWVGLVVVVALIMAWREDARAEEEKYEIKLERALAKDVPYTFRKVVAVRHERQPEVGGKPLPVQVNVRALEFHGVFTILEHDARGRERKNAYEVSRFVLVEDEKERVLLKPGTKFIATAGKDGATFELEAGPDLVRVNPELQSHLRRVIGLREDKGPGMDEMYGSAEPREVGESWPINAEKVAEAFSGPDTKVKAKDVEGKTTLVGVEEKDGVRCLKLRYETTVKHMDYTPADAPIWTTFTGGKREYRHEGLLPIDLKSPIRLGTTETTEEMTSEQPGQRDGVKEKMRMVTRYTNVHEVGVLQK